MGVKANLDALKRFRSKVVGISNVQTDSAAMAIAQEGKRIAEQLYSGENVTVSVESNEAHGAVIRAMGDKIIYLEYGTGDVGKGTYTGELPKRQFSFESPKGHMQSTSGWEYNYPNKYTKKDGGWYYKDESGERVFTKGEPAQAQMWKTAMLLREKQKEIVKAWLREDKTK